jgi:hypothetical protein
MLCGPEKYRHTHIIRWLREHGCPCGGRVCEQNKFSLQNVQESTEVVCVATRARENAQVTGKRQS